MRLSQTLRFALLAVGLTVGCTSYEGHADSPLPVELADAAEQSLKRAATFFSEKVAIQGSYVWKISVDGTLRAGEAKTDNKQGWVQPPGTPAIGFAYGAAYEATGDPFYLEAAFDAGRALAKTQLLTGGWYSLMEFDPERRAAWCYRQDRAECDADGPRYDNRNRDASVLDDDITQSAIRFLIYLDRFGHDTPIISDAALYGSEMLLRGQYPNGAWPINLAQRVGKSKREAKVGDNARYPVEWSRTFVNPPTPEFFVLNDHLVSNAIKTMLLAHQHYGDGRFLQAAIRAGDFLLAAQMPAPQSGWAHVYSSAMEPIWGRKFEPPALASWETASTISILIDLYRYTGLERFWEAADEAVAWLEGVRIGDDLWARFYELESNRPLYVTSDYELTYDDGDLPKHYGFQDEFGIPAVLDNYRRLSKAKENGEDLFTDVPVLDPALPTEVGQIVGTMDEQGRWLDGDMIRSTIFVDNVETLAEALALASGRQIRADRLFLPSSGL